MNTIQLTHKDRAILLTLARQSIKAAVAQKTPARLPPEELTDALLEMGASFVTLTIDGELRGCIGALEAYQPLVDDVQEHAIAAALEDYRFSPVTPPEVPELRIEISRLTPAQILVYDKPSDLPGSLHPGVDGVILKDGMRRATFLPQVWEKIPNPQDFLSELCSKMRAPWNLWMTKKLQVFTYQVEEFHEE